MKSGRLTFTLVGTHSIRIETVTDERLRKSITIPNNRLTAKQLIAALEELEHQLAQPAEYPSPTEGTEEVQREARAEKT